MSLRRLGLLLALPTVVGLSLAACGTEDDAAPSPPAGGSGPTAGTGGTAGSSGGKGGTGAGAGMDNTEGGMGGQSGPTPSEGGSAGDTAAQGGAGGDGPSPSAGDGNMAGAGGEGGQAPIACHTDLQNFNTNPGAAMGIYLGPAAGMAGAQTGPVMTSTVVYSSTEGSTAPGSGQLNANFSAFGDFAQLGLFYSNTSWTCHSKLHAMVKLVSATDLSHIAGIEFSLSSNGYAIYTPQLNSTAGFPLNTWKPIVVDFATATPAPKFTDISGIGIQLKTVTSGTTPVATTMYVDDVWVE